MHRTATTAVALGALALAFAACGGSKSESSSDAARSTTTTAASQGGAGSGATKGGVDLTLAAAGSIPETHITVATAPSDCQLDDARSISVSLMPTTSAPVQGLGAGDFINFTDGITKISIGGQNGIDAGSLADHSSLTTSGSRTTLTITDFPVSIGGTATTMSGTVTCPKG